MCGYTYKVRILFCASDTPWKTSQRGFVIIIFPNSFELISVFLTRLVSPTREWNEQNVFFVRFTSASALPTVPKENEK